MRRLGDGLLGSRLPGLCLSGGLAPPHRERARIVSGLSGWVAGAPYQAGSATNAKPFNGRVSCLTTRDFTVTSVT